MIHAIKLSNAIVSWLALELNAKLNRAFLDINDRDKKSDVIVDGNVLLVLNGSV